MKKKKILITVAIAIILIFTSLVVNAQEYETTGFSEKYEEWLSLPEKEREGTIAPLPFNVRVESDDGIFTRFKNLLKSVSIPSKYDLRDKLTKKGMELEVKNQMDTGQCWAFSSLSTAEINLALKNGEEFEFSERHMEYNTSKSFFDGQENEWALNRYAGEGGYATTAFTYYSRGTGPIPEELMPFENNEIPIDINTMPRNSEIKQIENMVYLPCIYKEYNETGDLIYTDAYGEEINISETRNEIKKFIMENGAIVTAILAPGHGMGDYNEETYAVYNHNVYGTNHDVTIIGWDDNYSKENFLTQPKEDGAYIVLNSWGEQWGDNGVYYISYEDLMVESNLRGVSQVENITYDTIYQYDISEMWQNIITKYGANVFTTSKDEILNKIMIGSVVEGNCNVYLSLEENGFDINNRKKIASNVALNNGYTTIKLDESIEISKGKKFAIIVEIIDEEIWGIGFEETEGYGFGNGTIDEGESYVSNDGTNWDDLYNEGLCNLSIKAFAQSKEKYLEVSDINGQAYSNIGGDFSFDILTTSSENGNNVDIKIKKEDIDVTDIFKISGNTVMGKAANIRIKCPNDIAEGLYTVKIGVSDFDIVEKQFLVSTRDDFVELQFEDKNFVKYLSTKLNDKLVFEDEMKIYTTQYEIENVDEFFDGRNKGITNINGIENFVNLSVVFLDNNKIEDFTHLNKLDKLNSLALSNTGLAQLDIEQLPILNQLSYIDLSYNEINDISFIKNNNNLMKTSLRLDYSLINEPIGFSELFEYDIFDSLSFAGSSWLTSEKISNIKNLTNLKHLDLSDCAIDSLENLRELNLERLVIENYSNNLNTFESLEPISNMTTLKELDIAGNEKITSLNDLEKLVNLEYFAGVWCRIEDTSALEKLEKLNNIHLYYNWITIYTEEEIVEVPKIIEQAYNPNSKIFSPEGISLEGCSWVEEGKTVRINKNTDINSIEILSGPALQTVTHIYYGEEPIIPEGEIITITIPNFELYEAIKRNITFVDTNDEQCTISTYESVINGLRELDLSYSHDLKTLNGISNFPNLETIKLKYCYELEDISDILNLENIKEIYISQQNEIDFTPILEYQFNNNLAIITENDYSIYSYPDIELQEYMYDILELSNGAFEANIYYDIEEEWPFNIKNEDDRQQAQVTINHENKEIELKYDNKVTEEHPNLVRQIEFKITEGPFAGTRYSQIYEVTEIIVKQEAKRMRYLEGEDFEQEGLEFLILNEDGEYVEVEEFEVLDGENLSAEKNWVDIMLNSNPELIYEYWIDLYKEEWTIKIQVEDENLYNALKSEDTYSRCFEDYCVSNNQFYESLISVNDEEKILYTQEEWLQHVQYIDLSNKDIKNIEGLEGIIFLQNIDLSENTQLDCIDNLAQLERLNTVILNNTSVEDISALLQNESVQKIEISKKIEDTIMLENNIIELPEYIYQLMNEEGTTIDAYISNCSEQEIEGTIQLAEKVDIEIVDGKPIIKIENYESEENVKLSLIVTGGKANQSTFEAKYQLPKIEEEKLTIEFIDVLEEEGIISNINVGTTIQTVKEKIETNGEIKLYTKDDVLIETDQNLATGMKLKISFGEETLTYTLAVTGDCNGDGKVRVGDLTTMMVSVAENLAANKDTSKILERAWLKAVDLNLDGKLSVSDITMLKILIAENK